MTASTSSYHHGDLHAALLAAAGDILSSEGIDGLSLRKLSERVGVSRSAPYHHFKDKHDLLCALAEQGFIELDQIIAKANLTFSDDFEPSLRAFIDHYLQFAMAQPERYELMFGRTIWKTNNPTPTLKQTAYGAFQRYAQTIGQLFDPSYWTEVKSPLRLAQASWAMLHGLCRLQIDGIYINSEDIAEVSEAALQAIVRLAKTQKPGN